MEPCSLFIIITDICNGMNFCRFGYTFGSSKLTHHPSGYRAERKRGSRLSAVGVRVQTAVVSLHTPVWGEGWHFRVLPLGLCPTPRLHISAGREQGACPQKSLLAGRWPHPDHAHILQPAFPWGHPGSFLSVPSGSDSGGHWETGLSRSQRHRGTYCLCIFLGARQRRGIFNSACGNKSKLITGPYPSCFNSGEHAAVASC